MVSDVDHASTTIQVGSRSFHGEAITWGEAKIPGGTSGRAWPRVRGGLHRIRVNIAEDASWNSAQGVYAYLKQAGVR
jgi:hypothetical protein